MEPYSYNFWQQIFPFLRGSWVCPKADPVNDRVVDTTKVNASTPYKWPDDLKDVQLRFNASSQVWDGSVAGIPIQRVPATNRKWWTFTENNTYKGTIIDRKVPVPTSGAFWVEGNPNRDGAWDRHVLLVCPETREAWEMIRVTLDSGNYRGNCLTWGYYKDGVLVDGTHACAAQQSMSRIFLAQGDKPHRLAIGMTNYVGWDGTKDPSSGWPRCGDVLRLSESSFNRLTAAAMTQEQKDFLISARDYGFVIYDRGGTHVFQQQSGANWDTSSLRNLPAIRYSDFELVIS